MVDQGNGGPGGNAAPKIFDRRLLQMRRARAVRQAQADGAPDFLLAWVRDDIAERLAVIKRDFRSILSLGGHSGLVGGMLAGRYPEAAVIESDACAAMAALSAVKGIVADEEALPFAPASLDLVASALVLHHVNDLPGALVQIRKALVPDGLFIGAMLGGGTLHELRSALTEAEIDVCGGASPRVAPFADVRDAGALLQRAGFALPVTDIDSVTVTYATMFDLMRDLRGMGATNVLADRRPVPAPRKLFMRAAEIYQDRFSGPDGRITATFDVITMTAWAPAPGQQKPLKPGSAAQRLADVLARRDRSEDKGD